VRRKIVLLRWRIGGLMTREVGMRTKRGGRKIILGRISFTTLTRS
jgi:hypothetical protein